MKKILLIQSRTTPDKIVAEREAYQRATRGLAEFSSLSTLDVEKNWETPEEIITGFDAVIFGGSSDFFLHGGKGAEEAERLGAHEVLNRVRVLIEHVVKTDTPTLGVCFGHQLIAEVQGGDVTHDHTQKKMGTFEVRLTEDGKRDRLFSQLPSVFLAQYAHRDSVTALPRGASLMATGDTCRFSALRYGERVYTTQFHPELIAQDLLSAPEAAALYLTPGVSAADVVTESPDASRILAAFIQTIL